MYDKHLADADREPAPRKCPFKLTPCTIGSSLAALSLAAIALIKLRTRYHK